MAATDLADLPDDQKFSPTFWPTLRKKLLIGEPLINDHLENESLPRMSIALGPVPPDAISSTVYQVPSRSWSNCRLPGWPRSSWCFRIALVIALLILALVTASYRESVMAYAQRGGSYVVARSDLRPRIAQIYVTALLIDYVVTVAVQCASGHVRRGLGGSLVRPHTT